MTPQQIRLVRDSFARIAPSHQLVGARFYENLFRIDPSLRSHFQGDMREQGTKLIAAMAAVVRSLDEPSPAADLLRDLGKRHVGYGVDKRHYSAVGTALLETLGECFGPAFNAHLREAWVATFAVISDAMNSAGTGPARAA
ncbi:MAG: hypothetical protein JNN22_12955 [Rhodospirillales bacterium]|nr:hypothetical protein [Rhodospirillales bacterium]